MKWVLTLAAVSFLQIKSFAGDKDCLVTGKLSGITKEAKIFVLRSGGDHGKTDTLKKATINANGAFSFVLPANVCNEMYEMRIEGIRNMLSFIAEKGHVEISGDVNKLYTAEIKGTPDNERWMLYKKAELSRTMRSNQVVMGNVKLTKEEKVAFYQNLEAEKKHYTDSLINNYPNSVFSLYLAHVPIMMLKYYQIDSLLTIFKPYFTTHPYYVALKKRADILRKVAPGAIAPDFAVIRPDKSKIKLSSFRGKYVMLDFWASWCVPCRAENVHTKEMYEKYHSAGLEVISFSLDSDLEAWRQALEKDGLIWNNASDLVGGVKSPVAKAYGIDGIPAIWIIDPTGKIIAEGVRGEALDKVLASIFTDKKG